LEDLIHNAQDDVTIGLDHVIQIRHKEYDDRLISLSSSYTLMSQQLVQ